MNEEQSSIINVEELPSAPIYPETMTIYYRKKTGEIKMMMSDTRDMAVFGDEADDYSQIWDYINIPFDELVRTNQRQFSVDVETKELIYTPLIDTSKYRMRQERFKWN